MFSFFLLSLLFVPSLQTPYENIPRSFGALEYKTALLYSFKGIPNFNETLANKKRELYHYEQTIVVKTSDLNDKVFHCEILEVYHEQKAIEVLKTLSSLLNIRVKKVYMDNMVKLMNECDSVDDIVVNVDETDKSVQRQFEMSLMYASPTTQIFSGIYPGTNWCGFGDVADSYHDLGKLRNVDRCCRAHDLCPIKILGKDMRYELTNTAIYTKSHCICDKAFYNCLKKENSWSSKLLGNLYFYVASPQCIEGLPELDNAPMIFIPPPNKW